MRNQNKQGLRFYDSFFSELPMELGFGCSDRRDPYHRQSDFYQPKGQNQA